MASHSGIQMHCVCHRNRRQPATPFWKRPHSSAHTPCGLVPFLGRCGNRIWGAARHQHHHTTHRRVGDTQHGHCVASWAQRSFTKTRLARCPLASFNRLASRLSGTQSAPRSCARPPSPRAKVAQGMPERPTLPAHALGAAFHAGAFRLALDSGRRHPLRGRQYVGPPVGASPRAM